MWLDSQFNAMCACKSAGDCLVICFSVGVSVVIVSLVENRRVQCARLEWLEQVSGVYIKTRPCNAVGQQGAREYRCRVSVGVPSDGFPEGRQVSKSLHQEQSFRHLHTSVALLKGRDQCVSDTSL